MSTLKVNTIQNTSGGSSSTPEQIEQGRAKIWCSWNGIGTVSIYDSFGVSSVTDNGTGDFILNFSNNMSNTNYAFTWASGGLIWNGLQDYRTTSTLRCLAMSRTDAPYTQDDSNINCIAIFGDN